MKFELVKPPRTLKHYPPQKKKNSSGKLLFKPLSNRLFVVSPERGCSPTEDVLFVELSWNLALGTQSA
jgi:hypothetical protein